MNIVCIAWGSLLWRPGPVKLASGWHPGGPPLPLEFARDSDDSAELALVLCPDVPPVPTYWAYVDAPDLEAARAMLHAREKIDLTHPEWVGSMQAPRGTTVNMANTANTANTPPGQMDIAAWLRGRRIDAAVWTALPPKFGGATGRMPTADEAIAFLAALQGETRLAAEHYLRRTPPHIDTRYRRRIIAALGWTPARDAGVTHMA